MALYGEQFEATDYHGLDTDKVSLEFEDTTEAIIGSAFEVCNTLGYGFLERVYQRALQVELLRRGHSAEIEHAIKVRFKEVIVGEYAADLLVDGRVIVELKVAKEYSPQDEAQLLNQLKATEKKVGLRINFGKFKRFILLNKSVFIRVNRWLKIGPLVPRQ